MQTLSAAGQSLPGGLSEIITPGSLYMKWSVLTQELHASRPWLAIPVSALSKSSGVNLSQLFSQATSTSPLNESQLLTGATGVRKAGTGTLDGVDGQRVMRKAVINERGTTLTEVVTVAHQQHQPAG